MIFLPHSKKWNHYMSYNFYIYSISSYLCTIYGSIPLCLLKFEVPYIRVNILGCYTRTYNTLIIISVIFYRFLIKFSFIINGNEGDDNVTKNFWLFVDPFSQSSSPVTYFHPSSNIVILWHLHNTSGLYVSHGQHI